MFYFHVIPHKIKQQLQTAEVVAKHQSMQPISTSEWETFVKKNKVTDARLKDIAERLKTGKKLAEREQRIYIQKKGEIDKLING